MKFLTKIVYWAQATRFFSRVKKRHIESITGIENLPATGPFIVVANHSSFVDHYLIGALFKQLYDNTIYFLTKKESFENRWSRFWHKATNCIPVDREKPDIAAFKTMLGVLKEKRILVVYPEGTRGPGDQLLPFKVGAFKIAARMNVPIIPIGLVGVSRIMPKDQSHFSPYKASINIGKPITVDFIKQQTIESLTEYTRQRIIELSLADRKPNDNIANLSRSSSALVRRVEAKVEEALESGEYHTIKNGYKQNMNAIDYSLLNIPDHIPSLIQKARLIGIKALASKTDFLMNIGAVKKLAVRALQQDRNHAFANYILGQYYLKMPVILGGKRKEALRLLKKAFQNAPTYGIEQSKFRYTLAEAYEKAGDRNSALQLLQIAQSAQGEGQRFENRKVKIMNKIKQLSQTA